MSFKEFECVMFNGPTRSVIVDYCTSNPKYKLKSKKFNPK